ncbi:MAG: FAD-dependent oxidoreductase [Planctomycetaceae bacterium]|nr:MAG: FAD-dependent oxidoreductase [Planctomycetaceae bacterium]
MIPTMKPNRTIRVTVWIAALAHVAVGMAAESKSRPESISPQPASSAVAGAVGEPVELLVRRVTTASDGLAVLEQSERNLPVVGRADVVIAGGGVAGVAAALRLAQSGSSVILIEQRNQLGYELTATYRCQTSGVAPPDTAPTAQKIWEELATGRIWSGHRVDPHRLRTYLHQRLADEPKITTYLFSMPTGVIAEDDRVCGVVFSSHNGCQAVLAKSVIDATSDARIARAAGCQLARDLTGTKTARRFIAVGRTENLPRGARPMRGSLRLAEDRIVVHDGFVELTVHAVIGQDLANDLSAVQQRTMEASFAVRDALVAEGVKLGSFVVGPEAWIDEMPVVVCRTQRSQQEIDARDFSQSGLLLPIGVRGLVVTGRIADPHPDMGDLSTLLTVGDAAGQAASRMSRRIAALPATGAGTSNDENRHQLGAIRELLEGLEPGQTYPTVRHQAIELPVRGEYDVLVVGGGTSGAIAAIAAARQGARTAVIEVLPNLGGTSSNRVNSYYWGVPWKSRLRQEVGDRIRLTKSTGTGPLEKVRFSGEDKKFALQDLAVQAGVTIYYQSFGAGAVVENDRVTGVVIENAAGRHVLLARVVIDATGHAAIAAAAGGAYQKGRCSDGFLHEIEHGPLRDPTHPGDISVSYLQAPSPAVSLNIRESRRILGDYVVTFEDAIHQRVFPDTICRWRSNYDTHFPNSANQSDLAQDWTALLGLWRRPILGSIPYRCLLPQGLENILVTAKAYSTDHDALVGGRMQSDLEHLGEAAGVAAAMACRLNVPPRQVPVDRLQDELVRLGVLRDDDVPDRTIQGGPSLDELHRQDLWRTERQQQFPPSSASLTLDEAVARLGTDQALEGMVRLYLAGDQARKRLRPLLAGDPGPARDEAALILGMLGDRTAVPVLIEWLEQRNVRRFVYTLPEASHRPSVPLYWSAVILLGRFGERQAVPAMIELLGDPPPKALAAARRGNYNDDMFEHIDHCPPPLASLIIVALGRIGDARAVDAIRPYLSVSRQPAVGEENRDFETAWAIRTNAAWALAQLGDRSGKAALEELLEADQAMLRQYARQMLEELSGRMGDPDR